MLNRLDDAVTLPDQLAGVVAATNAKELVDVEDSSAASVMLMIACSSMARQKSSSLIGNANEVSESNGGVLAGNEFIDASFPVVRPKPMALLIVTTGLIPSAKPP
jgi:hypothetical protein